MRVHGVKETPLVRRTVWVIKAVFSVIMLHCCISCNNVDIWLWSSVPLCISFKGLHYRFALCFRDVTLDVLTVLSSVVSADLISLRISYCRAKSTTSRKMWKFYTNHKMQPFRYLQYVWIYAFVLVHVLYLPLKKECHKVCRIWVGVCPVPNPHSFHCVFSRSVGCPTQKI